MLSYRVGSANDAADRDPRSWVLEGSNDGNSWTAIDTQSSQAFSSRLLLRTYNVTNTAGYNRYRFSVTGTNGSLDCQLSELQLFGY